MADLPGGASGLLVRDYSGKEADRLVTRIDPGVVSLVPELRARERPGRRGIGPVEGTRRGAQAPRRKPGGDRAGHDLLPRRRSRRWNARRSSWRNRGARTTRWIKCRKPSTGSAPR
jgi:hypothetical protein